MKTAICILFLKATTLITLNQAVGQTGLKQNIPAWLGASVGSTKQGASQDLMNEYADFVSKYGTTGELGWAKFEKNISNTDLQRLEQIYKKMSTSQQARQKIAFIKPPQPLKKITPTNKQINAWKNETIYGLWIDGKKTKNAALQNYVNTAFEQVTVSKLYGAAKQNKKYSYQVSLMTREYYRNYQKQAIPKHESRMVFRS